MIASALLSLWFGSIGLFTGLHFNLSISFKIFQYIYIDIDIPFLKKNMLLIYLKNIIKFLVS